MSKIVEAAVKLTGSIDPSLSEAVNSAKKTVEKLNLKKIMGKAKDAAVSMAKAVGKGTLEAGKYMVELGQKYEAAQNTIRVGTGATGEALDGFMDTMKNVYGQVPADMDQAASAVADFNTRLGVSGEPLEKLSVQALQTSKMLSTDLTGTIEKSSKAFQAWNMDADQMSAAMDYVWKASQSTGTGFDDLMTKAQQMAPTFQDMGFTFEESVALFGQMDKAGVNANEVMSAMKKSVGAMAKDGIAAADGFQMYADQIKAAGSETEAAQIAMEVFGSKAGPTMAKAIREGKMEMKDLVAELQNSSDTIQTAAGDTMTLGDKMETMQHKVENAMEPLGSAMLDALDALMPGLESIIEGVTPIIENLSTTLGPVFDELGTAMSQAFETAGPLISEFFATAGPMLADLGSTIIPPLASAFQTLAPVILQVAQAALPPLAQLLGAIIPPISQLVGALLPPLAAVFTSVCSAIGPLIGLITSVVTAISPLISYVGQLIGGMLSTLSGLFDALGIACSAAAGFVNGVATAIGNVVSWCSNAIGAIGNLAGKIKELAGGALGKIGSMLGFAHGGFSMGPGIVGEDPAYPVEAVISFNPSVRQKNLGYWAAAGEMLGVNTTEYVATRLSGGTSGSGAMYDLSGLVFSPQITVNGNGNAENILQALLKCKDELIDTVMDAIEEREAGNYGRSSFVF